MGKTAILFPGQGAQHVGMGRDLIETSPAARRVFEEANALLGFDLMAICFDGPADKLNATDVAQPAILVHSMAMWRAIQEVGADRKLTPEASAGLSLGEFTALWLAGALDFADVVRVVRERGQAMQAACEASAGTMLAVAGLDAETVEAICDQVREGGEVLNPANYNSPTQLVISGQAAPIQRAAKLVGERGGQAVPLRVAGAFHSALMAPAAEKVRSALAQVIVHPPGMTVVSNVTGGPYEAVEQVCDWLTRQVTSPVRWYQGIEWLIDHGYDRFVEVGPGKVLTGLLRRIGRKVQGLNVGTASALRELTNL
jgi:[acyl-carrier-protein] S-malonyltransferase